jgi:glycosyltransferase involved in cell wall biosynthesis
MKISCVIVSFNNGRLLEDAIMSVIRQTRPVDQVIVADDGSTDGSRELIASLSRRYPQIRAILRERNLGVSANRDLAIREAEGDFFTTLDGDDYFLPTKIEAEARALHRSSADIAYSDLQIVDDEGVEIRAETMPEFAVLDATHRVRWLLWQRTRNPREMLMPKAVHLEMGGYDHSLRTYEDWDYKIRLVALPRAWVHSGVTGVVIRRHGHGLSSVPIGQHIHDQYSVLKRNRGLAYGHVGRTFFLLTGARLTLMGTKWWLLTQYWSHRKRPSGRAPRGR